MISAPIDTDFAALYKALYHLHRDDVETTQVIKNLEVKSIIQKHHSTRWNFWREQLQDMGNLTEGWSSTVPLTSGKATLELMDALGKFMSFDGIRVYLGQFNFIKINFEFKGEKYTISAAPNGSYMLYQGAMQSPDQKVFNAKDNAQAVKTLQKWANASKKKRKQAKKAKKAEKAQKESK